jgi:hypothetical protein
VPVGEVLADRAPDSAPEPVALLTGLPLWVPQRLLEATVAAHDATSSGSGSGIVLEIAASGTPRRSAIFRNVGSLG